MANRRTGVYKDKNGTYRINTKIQIDGKVIHLTRRGFKTQQQAFIEKERLRREIFDNNGLTDREKLHFLVDLFLDYKRPQLKDSNIYRMKILIHKHLAKYFDMYLYQVSSIQTLNNFMTQMSEINISIDYKNKIIRAFRDVLTYGYNRGIITSSDFKNINLILVPFKNNSIEETKSVSILTKDQYKAFLDAIPNETRDKVLFTLWGQLGARIGEIRGLQVKHFNSLEQSIRINQQANSKLGVGKFEITSPKSKKSNRKIFISKNVSLLLMDYIESLKLNENDFIFYGQSKQIPLSENSIRSAQQKYSTLANVPYIKPHGIRHSNTTWLLTSISSLNEIGDVSERLGHSSKKVTLDIYFHINKIRNNNLIDIVDF